MKRAPVSSKPKVLAPGPVSTPGDLGQIRQFVPSLDYEQRLSADRGWARLDSSRHFEKDSEVFRTLRNIARRLDELGIPYAIAGAMALFEHGVRRFTEDVDILVSAEGLKRIHHDLVGRGYRPKFEKAKNLRDTSTGVSIEFIVEGHYPGDGRQKPVAFPNPASVAVDFDGIKFLNLATLIELKLASGKSSVERAKDLVDVQELIRTLNLPLEFENQLAEYVRPNYEELWSLVNVAGKRYETLWRNKWLTADAKSLEDMIRSLRAAADYLEDMRVAGVLLDPDGGTSDDYARLMTDDPSIARKFDMHDESEFWDDDEVEDLDESAGPTSESEPHKPD